MKCISWSTFYPLGNNFPLDRVIGSLNNQGQIPKQGKKCSQTGVKPRIYTVVRYTELLFQGQDISAGKAKIPACPRVRCGWEGRQTAERLQSWNGSSAAWENGARGGAEAYTCWYQLGKSLLICLLCKLYRYILYLNLCFTEWEVRVCELV